MLEFKYLLLVCLNDLDLTGFSVMKIMCPSIILNLYLPNFGNDFDVDIFDQPGLTGFACDCLC